MAQSSRYEPKDLGAGRVASGLKLVAWMALLCGAIAMLQSLGHGSLASPPLQGWSDQRRWLAETSPDAAIVVVVRLMALALAWYLLGTSALAVVVRLSRRRALVQVCDAITLPSVRRLVGSAVGVTLMAVPLATSLGSVAWATPTAVSMTLGTSTTTSSPAPTTPPPPASNEPSLTGAPIMRRLSPGGSGPRTEAANPAGAAGSITANDNRQAPPDTAENTAQTPPGTADNTAHTLPGRAAQAPPDTAKNTGEARANTVTTDGAARAGSGTVDGEPVAKPDLQKTGDGAAVRPSTVVEAAVPSSDQANPLSRAWTVREGDHLWHVSKAVVTAAWGRPPTDAELAPYWRAVVELNRGHLRDRANPDLIFPGQSLEVPPPPISPPASPPT